MKYKTQFEVEKSILLEKINKLESMVDILLSERSKNVRNEEIDKSK